jgi:hypothetical protein
MASTARCGRTTPCWTGADDRLARDRSDPLLEPPTGACRRSSGSHPAIHRPRRATRSPATIPPSSSTVGSGTTPISGVGGRGNCSQATTNSAPEPEQSDEHDQRQQELQRPDHPPPARTATDLRVGAADGAVEQIG